MTRFVVGDDRSQSTLFPERLDDYLAEDNPVRAIDAFVDELNLARLGFGGVEPEATGRPAYHPTTLLKIYVYGYLNRVQSSRRLERECQRNIELVWLTGRLMPDFKTIADFRKDNGEAIGKVCREFVVLCRRLELFSEASVAIDGSKFKAVNTHHELTADLANGLAVVLAEVGYRLEVRHQAAGQPNQLDVALALPLQAPARLHPIEVSVDVNLQQCRRMVGRPSCHLRLDAAKAEFGQIKLINKDIDRPDRIVLAQIVV